MSDILQEIRKDIERRRKELRPHVEEAHQLEAALMALGGIVPARETDAPTRRRRGRPRGSRSAAPEPAGAPRQPARKRSTGRPKGSGKRAAQALALVSEQPGITIPELANHLGMQENYLYRVLGRLKNEGRVRKEGRRRWYPATTKATA